MVKVISVRFQTAGKVYYFAPGEYDIKKGDHVIVETARGVEYGRVVSDIMEVEEENIVRRARVECEELRENARQETAELHKNTLDYIDSLLADTDRKLSELLNNIRLERNEIRNHR